MSRYNNGVGAAGLRALLSVLEVNHVLRRLSVAGNQAGGAADARRGIARALASHHRNPRLRALLVARALCLAGRAAPAAGAPLGTAAWVAAEAPHWVLVRVCGLLKDR